MIENRNQILRLPNGFHNATVYIGETSMVKPITQRFLLIYRHFLIILNRNFCRASIYNTISQTLITRRAVHLRFNIVEQSLFSDKAKIDLLRMVNLNIERSQNIVSIFYFSYMSVWVFSYLFKRGMFVSKRYEVLPKFGHAYTAKGIHWSFVF